MKQLKIFHWTKQNALQKRDFYWKFVLLLACIFWGIGLTKALIREKSSKTDEIVTMIAVALVSGAGIRRSSQAYEQFVEDRARLLPWQFYMLHTGVYTAAYMGLTTVTIPGFLVISTLYVLTHPIPGWIDTQFPLPEDPDRGLLKPYRVAKRYYNLIRGQERGYLFGNLRLSANLCCQGILFVGGVGSGKTISLRLLLQDILPNITPGSDQRALIYAPKGNELALIRAIAPQCPIWLLDPFDRRHVRWNIAHDINTPTLARSLATNLAPTPHNGATDVFWVEATQMMLEAVAIYFILHAPGKWRLRDILLACENLDTLKSILADDPMTAGYLTPLMGDRLTHNIMVTIQAYLSPFKAVAALWEHAEHSLSLTDFLASEGVLMLSRNEVCSTAVDAINRLILQRFSELALEGAEVSTPKHWLVLDEINSLGRIPKFKTLAATGRSKGVALVAAFQSYSDLCSIYGHDDANTITDNFWFKAFFRINGGTTNEWASKQIGYAVSPAEFMALRPPNAKIKQGVTGYFSGHYVFKSALSSREIRKQLIPEDKREQQNKEAGAHLLPASAEFLQPWSQEDYERLNISHLFSAEKNAAASQPLPELPPNILSQLRARQQNKFEEVT